MNYAARLKQVQEQLPRLNCDALLIEETTDLLYLTGLELSLGKILITKETADLIVDGRYLEVSQQQTLYRVISLKDFNQEKWCKKQEVKQLGFDSLSTSFAAFEVLKKATEKSLTTLVALPAPLQPLRLIKDAKEIELLRKAAKLNVEGFYYLTSLLKDGICEKELVLELEIFWKKKGAKELSFEPIIAFGKNSSMPHYRSTDFSLKENTHILIDIGVAYHHYHSDMTRVLYWGEPENEIKKIYKIVQEAKNYAMELCRPGTAVDQLDHIARGWITSKGYGPYFNHNLGHGVGLNVHEAPSLKVQKEPEKTILQAGMVLTIEPGIYLPGIGGVRLEDTLLITKEGYENLTSTPHY